MQNEQKGDRKKTAYRQIMIRAYITAFLTGVFIFVLAGRINYWQGWLLMAFYLAILVFSIVFFAQKIDLIRERLKPGPGVKWWDKIFYASYVFLNVLVVVIGALDAGRFHWSPPVPPAGYAAAVILLLLSNAIVSWAMWTNKFFSSRVRIQTDRGHHVVTEGPYRYVRHPGYVGAILLVPSIAVVLGSVYALIPAVIADAAIILRTYLEDNTLKKELPGYADYAKKTRFRLIPGIW